MQIKPGETPDEQVDHLRALANRCNFPTDEEKEWNVQFHLVHTLAYSELVKKLLTLDLKATTDKMLETCRTHKAIVDNLNAMGLRSKIVNAVNKHSSVWPTTTATKMLYPQNQHACGNCTKFHAPGRASCPAKDSTCQSCVKIGHWHARCQSSSNRQKDPNKKPPRHGPKGGKQEQTHTVDVGDNYEPHCNEICVITIDVHHIILPS